MPTNLSTIRQSVREYLNENFPSFWTDAQLNRWINDGCRDVARRTETLQTFDTSLTAVASQATYSLNADVIRLHRVEFVVNSQVYPMEASTYDQMDSMWGTFQTQTNSYPMFYVVRGTPGSLTMQVYPVPSQSGTFNIFYYRLPQPMVSDTDDADLAEGWQDMVVLYCETQARRVSKDPTWKDAKQEYESRILDLISVTRQYNDQAEYITTGLGAVPGWLYSFGGDY